MGQWLIADLSVSDSPRPALDAAGHWYRAPLVSLCLGNTIVFAEISPKVHVSDE